MEDADTIEEVGIAAISWFKSKIEGLSKQVKETTRQEEVAGLEAGGGLDVNINSGPAGGSVAVNDIDKKYAEDARKLRKSTFEDWYKAGDSAGKEGVRPKV
jgi:hypothetical protein